MHVVQNTRSLCHQPGTFRKEVFAEELIAQSQFSIGWIPQGIQGLDLEKPNKKVCCWKWQQRNKRQKLMYHCLGVKDLHKMMILSVLPHRRLRDSPQVTSTKTSSRDIRQQKADRFRWPLLGEITDGEIWLFCDKNGISLALSQNIERNIQKQKPGVSGILHLL